MKAPMRMAWRHVGASIASANVYMRKREAIQIESGSSSAINVKSSQPYSHGVESRTPTRSTDVYAAMATPVSSAGSVARPLACDVATARMPMSSKPTPMSCADVSRSPRTIKPTRTLSKGADPRAIG